MVSFSLLESLMLEIIGAIFVWVISYFLLPQIMKLYSSEVDKKTVNPVQKINFGTINAILFLVLIK
ncbi:MAG: hypothetical protein CMM44_08565 [Rhodospirillaceae bacterium]|nr:hypothetical protein [Rhodospirillaceae bacterium]|tara:strand:- start:2220 stop:2417 length:198 start_codon:yes stop_codon:yes gene_type:complete